MAIQREFASAFLPLGDRRALHATVTCIECGKTEAKVMNDSKHTPGEQLRKHFERRGWALSRKGTSDLCPDHNSKSRLTNNTGTQPMHTNGNGMHHPATKNTSLRVKKGVGVLKNLAALASAVDTKPALECTLAVRNAAVWQVSLRINRHAWAMLGRPSRINIRRRLDQGFEITRGSEIALAESGQAAFTAQFSANKVGLSPHQRKATPVLCHMDGTKLVLAAPPEAWLSADGAIPRPIEASMPLDAPPPVEPTGKVLQAATAPAQLEQVTGRVGLTLVKTGTSSLQLSFAVSLALMKELGDPERVLVSGNVHEGFAVRAVTVGGVKVQYVSQTNCYFQKGLGDQNISRYPRKRILLDARVSDGAIKLVPPSDEWVRGLNGTVIEEQANAEPAEAADATLPAVEYPTPPTPHNASSPTAPLAKAQPSMTVETDTTRAKAAFNLARDELLRAKARVEAATGCKFMLDRSLRLLLAD